jgi:hypothetical protein
VIGIQVISSLTNLSAHNNTGKRCRKIVAVGFDKIFYFLFIYFGHL